MGYDVWSDVRSSDDVPDRPEHAGWSIVRTPPTGVLSLVCISRGFTGVWTHWWGGRTIPCRVSNCPAHDAGHSPRWHGYLLCEVPETKARVLFEFTEHAAATFAQELRERKTLRGLCFRASRSRARSNGRVLITPVKRIGSSARLPAEVPIRQVLSLIWGLTPEAGNDADGTGDVVPIVPKDSAPGSLRSARGGRTA